MHKGAAGVEAAASTVGMRRVLDEPSAAQPEVETPAEAAAPIAAAAAAVAVAAAVVVAAAAAGGDRPDEWGGDSESETTAVGKRVLELRERAGHSRCRQYPR